MNNKKTSAFKSETIADIVQYCTNEQDLINVFRDLKKATIERVLEGELGHHLGYLKSERSGNSNSRNGFSHKTITCDQGTLAIDTPRDRDSSFEPQLIQKGQRQFKGFDDKIISMYARGMSMRDIQSHIEEMYAVEVSHDFISSVTDKVLDEVQAWQNRPLDSIYPIIYLDCLVVKVKENNQIINKSLFLLQTSGDEIGKGSSRY